MINEPIDKYLKTQGMVDILESFEVRLGKLEETILPVYQVSFSLLFER